MIRDEPAQFRRSCGSAQVGPERRFHLAPQRVGAGGGVDRDVVPAQALALGHRAQQLDLVRQPQRQPAALQ